MEEMAKVNPNLAVSVLVQNVAGSILYDYGSPERARHRAQNDRRRLPRRDHGDRTGGRQRRAERQDHGSARRRRLGDRRVEVIHHTRRETATCWSTLAQTDRGRGRHGMQFFAIAATTRV